MSEREKTCEERIEAQLAGRLEDIRTIQRVLNAADIGELELSDVSLILNTREEHIKRIEDEDGDLDRYEVDGDMYEGDAGLDRLRTAAEEMRSEYPLSVEVKKVVKVQLSWGGPSDEFVVELDSGGAIDGVTYWFKDWFDGAQRPVKDQDAEDFLGYFTEIAELD